MTAEQRVDRVRWTLATGALVGAGLVWVALANQHPSLGPLIATTGAGALLWRWRRVASRRQVRLWLEERLPELRYALVALADAPHSVFRDQLERRVGSVEFGGPVTKAALRLVLLPLAFLGVMQLVVRPLIATMAAASPNAASSLGFKPAVDVDASAFAAIVRPPAYSRIAGDTIDRPTRVAALVGSEIAFISRGQVLSRRTMPESAEVARVATAAGISMVSLEPRPDSVPRVALTAPARDTVLAAARGTFTIDASARDDLGLASGWIEMIVSSGSGERFTFATRVTGRVAAAGARELRITQRVSLDTMNLGPGDIVHLRVVARDLNPAAGREPGVSETRTIRILRPNESDSTAIDAALPTEVRQGELSERMLIIMTEALLAKRSLSTGARQGESRKIGTEQGKLRKRVGEIVFARMTAAGDSAGADAIGDSVSSAEALLRAASAATGTGITNLIDEEEADAGPVVHVNRPLLEAFNAMWDAERRLGVGDPRGALPHMRTALAAIQRARAAERIYLRGRPPAVVLDLGRIRLSGKRDAVDPAERSHRASMAAPERERHRRFQAALDLLASDPAAAVDTLVLLRVDALGDAPTLAAALERAIDAVRRNRDPRPALIEARRTLSPAVSAGPVSRWTGLW